MAEWTCPRCTGPNPENADTCLFCGAVYHTAGGEGSAPAQAQAEPSRPPTPEGWSRFVDGWNGFSVLCPPGWQVVFHRGQVSVRRDPSGVTAAYLIMGHNPQGAPAAAAAAYYAQVISQNGRGAQARIEPPEPEHPERANLRYRKAKLDQIVEGRCTIIVDGEKLLLMGFEAPPEALPQVGPWAGPILSSFRPEQLMPRQRIVEPSEGAYTACIPQGWTCRPQLHRNNPAGKGIIRFDAAGDPQGRRFAAQTDLNWSFPIGMGGIMNMFTGGGSGGLTPATQFCQQWLPRNLQQIFPGHRPVEVYARPDLAQTAEAEAAAEGVPSKATCAVLVTEADMPGGPVRQKMQVLTSMQQGAGLTAAPTWMAFIPYYYRAPVEEFAAMEHILVGIVDSIQQHPAWKQRERQLMNNYLMQSQQWRAGMAAKTSQTLSETTDIITSGYWGRQASYDRISHERSNAILGVQDMADSTGTVYSVPSGYDQYWIDPRGTIFGGDYMTKPGWDWNPMTPVKY